MARPNPLADSDYAKQVAQAFVDGNSRSEMCKMFGVTDPDTITRWRRDPRVKNHALKLVEDRVLEITRKVDSTIAARLQKADELSLRELIEIRKEFLGGALRMQTEKADDATINEALEAMESDPELIADFEKLLERASEKKNKEAPEPVEA